MVLNVIVERVRDWIGCECVLMGSATQHVPSPNIEIGLFDGLKKIIS